MDMKVYELLDEQYEDIDVDADLEANVLRGAALLDEKIPDWATKVRGSILDGMFDMANWERCVVGTLELLQINPDRSISAPMKLIAFNGTAVAQYGHAAMALGFILSDEAYRTQGGMAAWGRLQQQWEIEVNKRISNADGL